MSDGAAFEHPDSLPAYFATRSLKDQLRARHKDHERYMPIKTFNMLCTKFNSFSQQPSFRFSPAHPQYHDYKARIKTFDDFPRRCYQKPGPLAAAGFFYFGNYEGLVDCVKCFWCDVGLCIWEEEDDPLKEHKKFSPNCSFARAFE